MKPLDPKPASTVVLARPDPSGGLEILLTRRPSGMKFLGGCYVFPGGSIEAQDLSEKVLRRCRGLSAAKAKIILGDSLGPELSLAHWVAVIRELFEEVGILLCATKDGAPPDTKDHDAMRRFEEKRQALVAGSLDFGSFLEAENLFCDLSRAVYFSHRVTPEIYSIRYDTRFYLASLPQGQVALSESEEVSHSLWIAPDEALRRANRSDFPMLPPTTTMLRNLAAFDSWRSLCEKFSLR
jgi:8-oxo-dGTP pyrophosphatase MutT (NUDIX family)